MESFEASKFADIRIVSYCHENILETKQSDLIDRSRTNYPKLWFKEGSPNYEKNESFENRNKIKEKVLTTKHCCTIRNLPKSYIENEDEIFSILSAYNPVSVVDREISDEKIAITFQFQTLEDALNACKTLNGRKLSGNILHVKYEIKEELREVTRKMLSEIPSFIVDSLIEHPNCSFVQICGLPNRTNHSDLLQFCQTYGLVLGSEIFFDEKANLFGFICFQNREDAKKFSIKFMDGFSLLNDRTGDVCLLDDFNSLSNYLLNGTRENMIFIKNVKQSVTERDLSDLFDPCGEIETIFINKSLFSVKYCDLTYALICFVDEQSAKKALTTMTYWPLRSLSMAICTASMHSEFKQKYTPEQAELRGELLYDWGPRRDELIKKRSRYRFAPGYVLYVGNLPEIKNADLKDLCQKFGIILNIKLKRNDAIYGLVKFQELESVYKAVVCLDKFIYRGNILVAQPARQCLIAVKNLGYEVEELLERYKKRLVKLKSESSILNGEEEEILFSLCRQWSQLEIYSDCHPLDKLFNRFDKI